MRTRIYSRTPVPEERRKAPSNVLPTRPFGPPVQGCCANPGAMDDDRGSRLGHSFGDLRPPEHAVEPPKGNPLQLWNGRDPVQRQVDLTATGFPGPTTAPGGVIQAQREEQPKKIKSCGEGGKVGGPLSRMILRTRGLRTCSAIIIYKPKLDVAILFHYLAGEHKTDLTTANQIVGSASDGIVYFVAGEGNAYSIKLDKNNEPILQRDEQDLHYFRKRGLDVIDTGMQDSSVEVTSEYRFDDEKKPDDRVLKINGTVFL